MREWLSGGAPPCQGGGRGFDPRLALEKRTIPNRYRSFFRALVWARKFDVYAPLRSAWKISEAKGNTYLFRFV